MAENEGTSSSRSSSAHLRPTITLPPRSSMDTLFIGGTGVSPGPMTLVSNFFSESDPDSECRSFSQLLAGAMTSPAAISGQRPSFRAAVEDSNSNSRDKESSAGDVDFRFKQSRPSGLMIAQSPMFTIPPGLSPTSLLDSPVFFSTGQGPYGMSHQQALAQVTAQAAQAHSQMNFQAEFPSSSSITSAASMPHQQMPLSMTDRNSTKESSEVSHYDQKSQPASFVVDKPADDGYNWRKYGQKQVKGSEYPRSYYKCTHPKCLVKKKVERSLDGQVTEIIYKGQHNHQPPQPNKRAKDTGNLNGNLNLQGNSESALEGRTGNYSLATKDQEFSQATHEQLSGSSDSEEVGNTETGVDDRDEDEPEAKRRNTETRVSEPASSQRTVTEPKIIVQTTSEVDLLDDGYRWRKYGQKVVKGNPYPRSYYKCTSSGCNVRKHVERAASDPKAVITTYEGKHNHDVPAAKNSSHSTANSNAPQLKPHNGVTERHASIRRTDFGNNDQQPIALLRFKEEHIT